MCYIFVFDFFFIYILFKNKLFILLLFSLIKSRLSQNEMFNIFLMGKLKLNLFVNDFKEKIKNIYIHLVWA